MFLQLTASAHAYSRAVLLDHFPHPHTTDAAQRPIIYNLDSSRTFAHGLEPTDALAHHDVVLAQANVVLYVVARHVLAPVLVSEVQTLQIVASVEG